MVNPFSLEGKVILITGASSGIGRQCCVSCSQMGARVILLARDELRLQETLQLMNHDKEHVLLKCDLNDSSEIETVVKRIYQTVGVIDGFVHAAGVEKTQPVRLLKKEDYSTVYQTNALSAFEFVRFYSNKKYFRNKGHIVLISSITSVIGRSGVAAYAASKGAMISAVRTMALELAPKGICINCISPGTVLTPLMNNYLSTLTEDEYNNRVSGFPLGLGESDDIANACVFLLSDASRWITGTNLIVDGGYTAR